MPPRLREGPHATVAHVLGAPRTNRPLPLRLYVPTEPRLFPRVRQLATFVPPDWLKVPVPELPTFTNPPP